ncbi:hypothetical protein LOD99_1037 [Oopsacas minuta]|uniref:Uncharacterized protein n=1 Tax=Oopsacas minuta TaxID=111878 RepID=A0AAV7K094_9METZ|nr:hypothetical protein LOD99_1037 [Oopsacas minuta]
MSQPINEETVDLRPDNDNEVCEEILDSDSTLSNKESLKFIGCGPKGDCMEQWNISDSPSSIFSSNNDVLLLNTDIREDNTDIREDNTDSNTGYGETDELYSQSMSSLLLNLNGFNTQESRSNILPGNLIICIGYFRKC